MTDGAAPDVAPRAGGLYGTVLVLAVLLAVSEDPHAGPRTMLAAVLTTVLVFWCVHVYADGVALRVARPDLTRREVLLGTMREEWPIVEAAVPPAVPLALGAVGILGHSASLWIAVGLGLVELFGWGLLVGRVLGRGTARSALLGLGNVALGLLMVLLKELAH